MSSYDPYACGPQCGCNKCDPCDEPKPLEVIITAGPPINEPDPCRELPIAYDASNACFYLWDDNTGWFEATGIEFSVTDSDPAGTGDTLILVKCGEETQFFNSRNTALTLEHRGTSDNDGAEWLVLNQTHGPNLEVNLSDLDSYVTNLALNTENRVLTLQQSQGKPPQTVNLTYLKQTATDETIGGNGLDENPLSVNWNRLCNDTETVPEIPANANLLYCQNGVVGKGPIPGIDLTGCIDGDFPDVGELCGDPLYLVLVGNGECARFATYSPSNPSQGTGTFAEAQPGLPQGQSGMILPDDFQDPTNYYSMDQLRADYPGSMNEARIQNSLLTRTVLELACPTRIGWVTSLSITPEADVAVAYAMRTHLATRWRSNGGAWQYPIVAATGEITTTSPFNALSTTEENEYPPRQMPAGTLEIETFYVAGQGADGVRLNANTYATGSGFVPIPRTNTTTGL